MASSISKDANRFASLFGPNRIGMDTMQLFRLLMQSPAWQSMMTNASLQGNQASQNLTQGLAQRGLTTSGIGTIAQQVGKSIPGYLMQQQKGQLFNTSMDAAMQNLMARMQAVSGLEQQRRQSSGFNPMGLLGAGLGTFGQIFPFLGGGGTK